MTNTLVFQRVEVVPGSHHDGIFLLTLTNQDGAPVVGATVMGHTIKSDGIPTFPVAQTGPGGQITYVMRTTAFGLNTLFIDAIEFPGCAWDAANSQTENGFDAEP